MGPNAGSGFLGSFTASTSGVVTGNVEGTQAMMTSFETKGDGAQSVTVEIQGTLVPSRGANRAVSPTGTNVPVRDDSVNSTDWVTLTSNVMASGAAWSRIDTIPYAALRAYRVRLTSGASTSVCTVFCMTQGVE